MSGLTITDLHKRFGSHPVLTGLSMSAPAGSFTAILGASGSGKTTLLRLLGGFKRADRGTIMIGERVVDADDRHLRPEQRRIGYVPQEGSLFPHLSVEANIGFGLPRKQRRQQASELLELVGLAGLGSRYPHQLSGGQQQRVALVRAILRKAGTTAVLVTHDQDEALSLADLIAVLRNGTIAQHATPQSIYTTPVDDELAQFIGNANLIPGTLAGTDVDTPLGTLAALWEGEPPTAPRRVTVLLRPEQIRLQPPHANGNGGLSGEITQTGYHGHDTVIHIQTNRPHAGHHLVSRTPSSAELTPGTQVNLAIQGPVLVWPTDAP